MQYQCLGTAAALNLKLFSFGLHYPYHSPGMMMKTGEKYCNDNRYKQSIILFQ